MQKCFKLRLGEKLDFDDPLNECACLLVPEASEIELKNVYFQRRRSWDAPELILDRFSKLFGSILGLKRGLKRVSKSCFAFSPFFIDFIWF